MTFFIDTPKVKGRVVILGDAEIIISCPYQWRSFIDRPLSILCQSLLKRYGRLNIKKVESKNETPSKS